MTIGELKQKIANLPDDLVLRMYPTFDNNIEVNGTKLDVCTISLDDTVLSRNNIYQDW